MARFSESAPRQDVQRERQMSERQAVPHLASAKESVADAEAGPVFERALQQSSAPPSKPVIWPSSHPAIR